MKDSKTLKSFIRFVVKVALIGLMAFGVWKFIFWYFWEYDRGPEAYASSYQRALLRQIYALEDEDRDPEIIVFGSSYVPFGIDTKTLETTVGDGRKAQILGIEAAIGVPYLIHVLEETAKPGDTVVYMLGESNPVNTDLISVSAALEPDKEKLFAFWKWRDASLPKSYLTWRKFYAFIVSPVSNKLLEKYSKKQPVYNVSSFDENGNMTLVLGMVTVELGRDEYLEEKIANLVQLYPEVSSQKGTLNMEGFTGKNEAITFREEAPAVEEEAETESAAPTEGQTGSETLAGVGTDSSAGGEEAGQDEDDNQEPAEETPSAVFMVFDSSGTLRYDARVVNGEVVDSYGNPIAGCYVNEAGNVKDAYWNEIDPRTGELIQP